MKPVNCRPIQGMVATEPDRETPGSSKWLVCSQIQDFGIDQDIEPPTMTESDDWRRTMSMILGDPTAKVGVLGFTDCIVSPFTSKPQRLYGSIRMPCWTQVVCC